MLFAKDSRGSIYSVPGPPPLPAFRVQEAPPFSTVAVNFAGPLFVNEKGGYEGKVLVCVVLPKLYI